MAISTCARFTGGPRPPLSPTDDLNPGAEIVQHLVQQFPRMGVDVDGVEDIQYARELRCCVSGTTYIVTVSYDWVTRGWWEIAYTCKSSWLRRLFGASDEDRMRRLTFAIAAALDCLPNVGEVRWYPECGVTPSREYTLRPQT